MKVAKDANGNYLDQLSKKSYQIDHLKKSITNENDAELELPEPVIELLEILSKKLSTYVDKYYK